MLPKLVGGIRKKKEESTENSFKISNKQLGKQERLSNVSLL